MTKFYGAVGYSEQVEDPEESGIWVDKITEVLYFGDVIRNVRRLDSSEKSTNPDISPSNEISIVADKYANEHFFNIRYVEWAGTRWTVTSVEVRSPRLILRPGGVYNGPTP